MVAEMTHHYILWSQAKGATRAVTDRDGSVTDSDRQLPLTVTARQPHWPAVIPPETPSVTDSDRYSQHDGYTRARRCNAEETPDRSLPTWKPALTCGNSSDRYPRSVTAELNEPAPADNPRATAREQTGGSDG